MVFSLAKKLVNMASTARHPSPMSRPTGSSQRPNWASRLSSTVSPGKDESAQRITDTIRMMVPAVRKNSAVRCQTPNAMVRTLGTW